MVSSEHIASLCIIMFYIQTLCSLTANYICSGVVNQMVQFVLMVLCVVDSCFERLQDGQPCEIEKICGFVIF